MGLGETNVSRRVLRVDSDGILEQSDALAEALLRPLVPEVAALQPGFMRLRNDDGHHREAALLRRRQRRSNFVHHGAGDCTLQTQNVAQAPFVRIGPYMAICSRIDELHHDSYPSP